ncbi:hypothetical protein [Brevundimonas sp.]|uniref:hypothetical protein n=1 Tax=Brevundimonas sp. TaxID=1871086 RepID=UPI0035B03DEC
MIKSILLATVALFAAGAATAQTAPAQTAPAPQQDHAAHAPAAARPTIESPIEALVNDPVTKAVLDKHLPGLAEHNAYGQFKRMTLRQVAPFSGGNITDDIIAAIDADLKALPPA